MKKVERYNRFSQTFLKYKDILFCVAIAFFFAIVGVSLSRNEVFLDDWYIEASADGLFGANNRSLWVVGTNYIFTFIIYVLSLTGIRLSWFHVLLVAFNFFSSVAICKIITNHIYGKKKYLFCGCFLIVVTPFVYFYLQFTTTAAYMIAAGCAWIFEIIEQKKKWRFYLPGVILVVLGAAIRVDCIYFSLCFMGLIWLLKIVKLWREKCTLKDKKTFFKSFMSFFSPFFLTLVLVFGIEVSQRFFMDYYNPGFREWNAVRCLIDDYEIPDYMENADSYKKIGMSFNDYQLLKSWNNLDPDFFTEDLYRKILDIKEQKKEEKNFLEYITNMMQSLSGNVLCVMFFLVIFCSILFFDWWTTAGIAVISSGILGLGFYFSYTGRLIWRTEWPIWIVAVTAFTIFVCHQKPILKLKVSKNQRILFSVIGFLMFLGVSPMSSNKTVWDPYKELSFLEIYITRFESTDNFIRYFKHKLLKEPTMQYESINGNISEYMETNKDIFYYRLWTRSWLQQYPLTDRDILRTAPVAAGENWGSLGQYILRLQPLQNNMEKYGIDHPFKDLVNENVRVAVKDEELKDRTWEINQYLKEHYYEDVSFSVENIVGNVAIGRYMRDIDTDFMNKEKGQIELVCHQNSQYNGMVKIEVLANAQNGYQIGSDEAYLQLISGAGESHTYTLFKQNDIFQTYVYSDSIILGEIYSINFVYKEDDNWNIIEGNSKLLLNGLYENYSTDKLDFSSEEIINYAALSGVYENEKEYAWTQKYSTIRLVNPYISEEGLYLKLKLPEYTNEGSVPIRIYVNSSYVYELAPRAGKYDIYIPPEKIRNCENKYFIEIECPYFVNPAISFGENDMRDLSIQLLYVGNPGAYKNVGD